MILERFQTLARSRKAWSSVLLLVLAIFAYGGVRAAQVRSLIHHDVDGQILRKFLRLEKHAGVDDVYFLVVQDLSGESQTFRVDRPIYEALTENERIHKKKGDREIQSDTLKHPLPLDYSSTAKNLPYVGWITWIPAAVLVGWQHWYATKQFPRAPNS